MTEQPPIDPALFEVICAKEWFEKYGAQMMPGYFEARITAYKRIEKEKSRSRPAPSPAPIRSMREDEDGYISWQQMNERALEEHDAAIAAQAREDVLDELAKEIDRVSKTWHHACALHEIVKSLRHREVQE